MSSTKIEIVTGARKANKFIQRVEDSGCKLVDVKFTWAHNDFTFLIIYRD